MRSDVRWRHDAGEPRHFERVSFFNPSSRMSFSVAGFIETRPLAVALRDVAGFADTSTMRAAPVLSRCVSFFADKASLGSDCGGAYGFQTAEQVFGAGKRQTVGPSHSALSGSG